MQERGQWAVVSGQWKIQPHAASYTLQAIQESQKQIQINTNTAASYIQYS
jgi:hypothetical protein